MNTFKLIVFEEHGSGEKKIQGIAEHGHGMEIVERFNIEESLPELIDDPENYINDDFEGDLVLDFLKHPDLSAHLAAICEKKGIPIIASGKKHAGAMTPFT